MSISEKDLYVLDEINKTYRRYARVQIDAIIAVIDLLKECDSTQCAIRILRNYILDNIHCAYDNNAENLLDIRTSLYKRKSNARNSGIFQ